MVPSYTISLVNDEFASTEKLKCADIVAARKQAIASALAIAADVVAGGKPYFGAEVTLSEDGEERARFVVSAGASMLKTAG